MTPRHGLWFYVRQRPRRKFSDIWKTRQHKYHATVIGRPLEIKASESLDEVFVEQEDIALFED
jgi:hypothetical protein